MKKLNNLLNFKDFDGSLPTNKQNKTKRTDVGLDILKENVVPHVYGSINFAHFDGEDIEMIFNGIDVWEDEKFSGRDSDKKLIGWKNDGRIFLEGDDEAAFLWVSEGDDEVIKYIRQKYPNNVREDEF